MALPRLDAVLLWVRDQEQAAAFYAQAMGLPAREGRITLPDGHVLYLCSGRVPCHARGPHGIVPVLEVADIAHARAWVQHLGRPIVFEEVVPGLARFIFLDPDGNPIDLAQVLDTQTWERGARIPVWKTPPTSPPQVLGLFELSLYARDAGAALRFYRDVLGLETGLAYFAHVHLLFENAALVIRPTWHRCDQREPHTPALVLAGEATTTQQDTCRAVGREVTRRPVCGQSLCVCEDGEHTWVCWR